jgi:hypothetical protein
MATPTMDNIKKKMQAMKNEKENAIEAADQAEEKTAQLAEKLRLVISHFEKWVNLFRLQIFSSFLQLFYEILSQIPKLYTFFK